MGHEKHQRPRIAARFSLDEVQTDRTWIDNKPIYRRIVDFGGLPNNTDKDVPSGIDIDTLDFIVPAPYGIAFTSIGAKIWLPIPWIDAVGGMNVGLTMLATVVRITTSSDMTNWTETYVVVDYTKK